ncbi:ERF family protein [Streptomyces caeruleatus]|uniref:Aromatic ring-opening dioxygenase LigA n=1 Tax=Streptomyces caeruleatus TaxID=661399 RepID=A0A101TPN6_9ACTN|nr:ERF family protein [Streptomyces caeruleatus]KUN96168.1 aromatic ring-opening dioxygenase LigA [Streptomyces caeruleatus]
MTVTPLHPGRPHTEPPLSLSDALARVQVTYVPPPAGMPEDAPRIFSVVNAVMRDTVPVGKNQENQQQRYKFRGIDDVMSAMAGPMRAHGLFILPSIAEHRAERRGDKMTHVVITMRYHVYGPAGDCLVADVPGEASDFADKATNKAQSAALKYLLFTVFMIPVDGRSIDDGDREHPVEPTAEHRAEREQRQQQRRQQRGQGQQRQQQPRRSNRAEPGPWERSPGQQQRPAGPRRDYLVEARKAPTPEAFAKVRAAAVADGAPDTYLAELDQVAEQKRKAAQQPPQAGQQRETPPQAEEHVIAVGELFDAARSAGVTDRAEVEQLFSSRHGVKPTEATVEQLREMRDDLLDAAKGASA